MPSERPWRPLVVNGARLETLWTALQGFPDALRLLRIEDRAGFVACLSSASAVFIDVDEGTALLVVADIEPGHGGTAVFVGLDGKLGAHAPGFDGALRYVMRLAALRRVTAPVPESLPVLVKLVTRKLGFSWEGVLREGWGPGVDLHVHGRLADA